MDELSNDNLKRVFGKLKDYNTQQSGVNWESVKDGLHENPNLLKRSVKLASVIIAVTITSGLFGVQDNGSQSYPAKRIAASTHQAISEEIEKNENDFIPDKGSKILVLDKTRFKKQTHDRQSTHSLPNPNQEEQSLQPVEPILAKRDNSSFTEYTLESDSAALRSDSVATIIIREKKAEYELQDSKPPQRKFGLQISLSPFYLFGVVDPMMTDNVNVSEFNSKSGFGVKTDILFRIKRGKNYSIFAGPSFTFMKKEFHFTTTEILQEEEIKKAFILNTKAHLLGIALGYEHESSRLQLGVTYYASVGGGGLDRFIGQRNLAFSIDKELGFKTKLCTIGIGASIMMPLNGEVDVFRYYPIQFRINAKRVFSGK